MAKAQWEADAKDRLITFLREEYGYSYVTTGEDVVSDPGTSSVSTLAHSAFEPTPSAAHDFRKTG
jgi:16S rRNA C1402 (ribose-2'-O) methylase RsmI